MTASAWLLKVNTFLPNHFWVSTASPTLTTLPVKLYPYRIGYCIPLSFICSIVKSTAWFVSTSPWKIFNSVPGLIRQVCVWINTCVASNFCGTSSSIMCRLRLPENSTTLHDCGILCRSSLFSFSRNVDTVSGSCKEGVLLNLSTTSKELFANRTLGSEGNIFSSRNAIFWGIWGKESNKSTFFATMVNSEDASACTLCNHFCIFHRRNNGKVTPDATKCIKHWNI